MSKVAGVVPSISRVCHGSTWETQHLAWLCSSSSTVLFPFIPMVKLECNDVDDGGEEKLSGDLQMPHRVAWECGVR